MRDRLRHPPWGIGGAGGLAVHERLSDAAASFGAALAAAAMAFLVAPLAIAAQGDPPGVTTPTVSHITTTSAVFETTVNPNGADTGVQFMCRRAVDPPSSFANCGGLGIGSGTTPVIVRQRSDGKDPATEYVLRVEADNANGVTISNEVNFETLPALPPTVTTPDVVDLTHVSARFMGEVDPNGTETTYRFEYRPSSEPTWISVPGTDENIGDRGDPRAVSQPVSGLDPGTQYLVRLIATNAHGDDTSAEQSFETLPPQPPIIGRTGASADDTTATLRGRVSPNNSATTYHFEYGTDTSYGTLVPVPDGNVGSGLTSVKVSEALAGLQPNTTYHFRLVASSPAGQSESSDRTFTTQRVSLPDRTARAYEQVSPPDKQDADVLPNGGAVQIAPSGDRVTFAAEGAFAGAPSSGGLGNTYLSRRGTTAWTTKAIDPPLPSGGGGAVFSMFSSDLSRAVVLSLDRPGLELAPGDHPGVTDLFRRNNDTDVYELLTPEPPDPYLLRSAAGFSWASSDLDHVIFGPVDNSGGAAFLPGAPPWAAYDWRGGTLSVASVLPSGSVAPDARPGAGLTRSGNYRAVSEDGSRIYFTAPSSLNDQATKGATIYVRRGHGTPAADTVAISDPEAGGAISDPVQPRAAFFRTASSDGERAFFTSCERLTHDSTASPTDAGQGRCQASGGAENDLYLYDLEANGGAGDLIDLTVADTDGADVLGVLAASLDGTRAYFVATGALDGAAVPGQPNLYLWEEGLGVTHIATLDPSDTDVWDAPRFAESEARVTPDGGHIVFSSRAQLTSFDNAGTRQVYLYDVAEDDISCASCRSGGPPTADATIRQQGDPQSRSFDPRNVVDDGSLVFFQTAEALSDGDTNGELDVYEYDAVRDRITLISTGRSGSPSLFGGASPDGDDVFFTTREQIVGWDQDPLVDLYDARVGGGLPEPGPSAPDCGVDCQGAPADRPTLKDPATAGFEGAGNLEPGPRAAFAIRRVSPAQRARLARTGRVTLRIRVNRAGRLTAIGRSKLAGRRRIVAKASKRAGGDGIVALRLELSEAARRHLKRGRRLRLSVSVRFTGVRERRKLTLSLRRPAANAGARSG